MRQRLQIPAFNQKAPFVVWGKLGVNKDSALRYLKNNRLVDTATLKVVEICPDCEQSIFTITGLKIGPVQQTASSTNSTGNKPSSDTTLKSPVFITRNYILSTPEPKPVVTGPISINATNINKLQPYIKNLQIKPVTIDAPKPEGRKPLIKVGVLDTGIDPEVAENYTRQGFETCMKGGEKGWNFAESNSNVEDDYDPEEGKGLHGSPVTNFIIEQATDEVNLQVLPIKIMDKKGNGDLFHVMCGLAYAQKAGVKIVNASFGFYADRNDDFVKAFEEYLKYITDQGMIIVAASGNQDKEQDEEFKKDNPSITDEQCRNLDDNPFFPAAFSDSNDHIISVTTLSTKPAYEMLTAKVSPLQNFSPSKTQVGVYADDNLFNFKEPFSGSLRRGSSYATAVVTGQIAANFIKAFPDGNVKNINRYAMLKNIFPVFEYYLKPVPSQTPTRAPLKMVVNKLTPLFQISHKKKS